MSNMFIIVLISERNDFFFRITDANKSKMFLNVELDRTCFRLVFFFVLMYGKVIKSWRGLKSKERKTLQGIHTFDGSFMLHASFDP